MERENDQTSFPRMLQLLSQSKNILVIGDVILDVSVYGTCDRIAPDIPVPVLTETHEECRLGGAGNVVSSLHEMRLSVDFVTVIGPTDHKIVKLLKQKGLNVDGIVTSPDFSVKSITRFFSGQHQYLRLDKNVMCDISETCRMKVSQKACDMMDTKQYNVVVLADYRNGLLSKSVCQKIICHANTKTIPIVVDPKAGDYERFSGATYIKPNKQDAKIFAGDCSDVFDVCRSFCNKLNLQGCILTLDENGIALYQHNKENEQTIYHTIPAMNNINVKDVCGAGDTVMACIAFGLSHQLSLENIGKFANLCAANVIEKQGTIPVSMLEIIRDKVIYNKDELGVLKNIIPKDKIIVATTGCFDLLHVGHVDSLRQAKNQGDLLIVALNSDSSVKKNKGFTRPVIPLEQRIEMLLCTTFVDFIVVFDEKVPSWIVDTLEPDVFVKGSEYTEERLRTTYPNLKKVYFTKSLASTSGIIDTIKRLSVH